MLRRSPGQGLQCVAVRHQIERYDDEHHRDPESDRLHPRTGRRPPRLLRGPLPDRFDRTEKQRDDPPQRRRRAAGLDQPVRLPPDSRHMAGPDPRQQSREHRRYGPGRDRRPGPRNLVQLHRPDPERRDQGRAEIRPSRFASDADLPARVQKRGDQQRNVEKLGLLGADLRPVREPQHRPHHRGQQSFLEQRRHRHRRLQRREADQLVLRCDRRRDLPQVARSEKHLPEHRGEQLRGPFERERYQIRHRIARRIPQHQDDQHQGL